MVTILPRGETLAEQLGGLVGKGIGAIGQGISSDLQRQQDLVDKLIFEDYKQKGTLASKLSQQQSLSDKDENFINSLKKINAPEFLIEGYKSGGRGERTLIQKQIQEMFKRGQLQAPTGINVENLFEETDFVDTESPSFPISRDEGNLLNNDEFKFPKLPPLTGFSPEEKSKQFSRREEINDKIYQEKATALNSSEIANVKVNQLEELEDQGNLESLFNYLNVDFSNNTLRFPMLAHPDVQTFVKIVNDFTSQAKDSYGARITNFELQTFLSRLPTLANSPEGRRQIYDYMKTMNELDRLYNESFVDVYNHYGTGNISASKASEIAKMKREKEKELIAKGKRLNSQLNNLYNKEYKKIIQQENEILNKLKLPGRDFVAMYDTEGEPKAVRKQDIPKASQNGYKIFSKFKRFLVED